MADRVEIINSSDGRPRVVPVEGQVITVGSAADAGIVIAGLSAAALRFCRTDRGYRAEPARPGGTITVNGESLFAKELAAGDVIELGAVRLRWLPAARPAIAPPTAKPRPAARSGSSRTARTARPQPEARRSRRSGMPLPALLGIVCSIVLGTALLLRSCSNSTWPKTPQHYVDLARAQYGNGQFQKALGTLEFALGEATGTAREQALQLQAQIQQGMAVAADLPQLQAARADLDLLRAFVGRYLQQDQPRPAAREFLRLCRQWHDDHGAVTTRHADAAAMAAEVDTLQQRFITAAHPDEPDTAADVIFAAQSHLRFQVREYKAACHILDAWLTAHPDDAAIRDARTAMLQDGAEWFDKRLNLIEQLIASGRVDDARGELRSLQQESLLPEWQAAFDRCQQHLQGR